MKMWLHAIVLIVSFGAIIFTISHFSNFKRVLIGRPIRSDQLNSKHNKLFWVMALLVLAADLYSSVAYGPEAGITELATLGPSVMWFIIPLTMASVGLLAILIISYVMAVNAYPNGGGAYTIARENYRNPGFALLASSALLVDYVLTVAVSVSSGIQTVGSAYPVVRDYAPTLSVLCVLLILIVNLRGLSESATLFAWPTLLFAISMGVVICIGLLKGVHVHGVGAASKPPSFGTIPHGLTMLLLLKAFSAASVSVTGIETISNAVPIFREPGNRNAVKAYITLGIAMGVTLLGLATLFYLKNVSINPNQTMLSQLLGQLFGHGVVYQIVIWLTFIVLILAANSTFTGFPQLAALVARDDYLPRSLSLRGDRLGYSNGMIILAAFASILIITFGAKTNALIPLYSIGVFISFTIAQIGLVRKWVRDRGNRWRLKLAINLLGAVTTGLVSIVVAWTKFTSGAWMVLIVLPAIMFASLRIKHHYESVGKELRIDMKQERPRTHDVKTLVLISGIHRVVLHTLSLAQSLHTDVQAIYVGFDEESIQKVEQRWAEWGNPCPLIVLRNDYRSLVQPIKFYIEQIEKTEGQLDRVHIIIPQFLPRKWWQFALHNQSALLLRTALIRHKDVVITTVPYHLH